MKNFIKSTLIFISSALFFAAAPVFAANLSFDSDNATPSKGQEFVVQVLLDSRNEAINAIEGKVLFPERLLEVKEVRDGNSIINFWVEHPTIEKNGSISFSGIIPGGYQDTKGLIFSIVFRARDLGQDSIVVGDIKILKNDGKGTPATVETSPLFVVVSSGNSGKSAASSAINDVVVPEIFSPAIGQDLSVFGGKNFLVFATQDKGSGVDHYEVREGIWGNFTRATSPYLLQNQDLDSRIFVKATDKNGNERTVVLVPPSWVPWYNSYWILGILVASTLLILWKKFTKSRS